VGGDSLSHLKRSGRRVHPVRRGWGFILNGKYGIKVKEKKSKTGRVKSAERRVLKNCGKTCHTRCWKEAVISPGR